MTSPWEWRGQLGKEENCVVGINVGYASEKGHAPIDRRLYLPEEWANDFPRRRAAGVPKDVVFRTSWELSYEMISQARREGLPLFRCMPNGTTRCIQDGKE